MEAAYIEHKKKRRNRGALWGANSDWAQNLRRALEYESALAFGEKRLDPGNQVGGDASSGEDISQLVCADVVKSTFDIQERVDTLKEAARSRRTSWVRVATAVKQPRPARDPH